MLKDSRKLCNFILSFEDRHLVDLNLFFFLDLNLIVTLETGFLSD